MSEKIYLKIVPHDAGYFSLFMKVLNVLICIDGHDHIIPIVDFGNKNYKSIFNTSDKDLWNVFFKPLVSYDETHLTKDNTIFCQSYDPSDIIEEKCSVSTNHIDKSVWPFNYRFYKEPKKERNYVSTIINKYISLQSNFKSKCDDFIKNNLVSEYVIGVHFRGTDGRTYPKRHIPEYNEYLHVINEKIKRIKDKSYKIFVATDEENFITYIQNYHNVVTIDTIRSQLDKRFNKKPVAGYDCPHFIQDDVNKSCEGVIMDYYILSNCDCIIHAMSNVTVGVLLTNEHIESILVKQPMTYEEYIKLKHSK